MDHLLDERMNMIDNENQLRFIYQMLWDGITQRAYLQQPVFTLPPTPTTKYATFPRKKTWPTTRKGKLSMENVWHAILGR